GACACAAWGRAAAATRTKARARRARMLVASAGGGPGPWCRLAAPNLRAAGRTRHRRGRARRAPAPRGGSAERLLPLDPLDELLGELLEATAQPVRIRCRALGSARVHVRRRV